MSELISYLKPSKFKTLFSLGAALFTSFLQVLGLYLNDNSEAVVIRSLPLYTLLFFTIYFIGAGVFRYLYSSKNDKSFLKSFPFNKTLILMGIIMLCWIPCFIAYFPSIYSYDGEPQLIQYTSGLFDNHHPVFHTLILGWCYSIGEALRFEGTALYSVLQMTLLSFSFAEAIRIMAKKGIGRKALFFALLYFALVPTHPLMAISTTKDTPFTACMVLLTVYLWDIVFPTEHKEHPTLIQILTALLPAVLSALGVMLFRRNGVYIIVCYVFMAGLTFLFCSKKNYGGLQKSRCSIICIICLISILAFFPLNSLLIKSTNALPGESQEALCVPLSQMARSYRSNAEVMSDNDKETLYQFMTDEAMQNYRPYIADGIKQQFNEEAYLNDKAAFFNTYINLGIKYPGSYISAFLYQTMGAWYPTDVSHTEVYKDWWRNRTGYLITDDTPVFAGYDFVKKSDLWPSPRNLYEDFATRCSFRSSVVLTLFFAPAMYSLLLLFTLVLILLSKNKGMIFIIIPLLLNLLTVLLGPCILIRYIYPFICTFPVLLALCSKSREEF